jgi:hypothetical protein
MGPLKDSQPRALDIATRLVADTTLISSFVAGDKEAKDDFVNALIEVPITKRKAVYCKALQICAANLVSGELTPGSFNRRVSTLMSLDMGDDEHDIDNYINTRYAIASLPEETRSAMYVALSAKRLQELNLLESFDYCTPDQMATMIRYVAGELTSVVVQMKKSKDKQTDRNKDGYEDRELLGTMESLTEVQVFYETQLGYLLDLTIDRGDDCLDEFDEDTEFSLDVLVNLVRRNSKKADSDTTDELDPDTDLTVTMKFILGMAKRGHESAALFISQSTTLLKSSGIMKIDELAVLEQTLDDLNVR